jgi:diacylglycerol kinase family enzyme
MEKKDNREHLFMVNPKSFLLQTDLSRILSQVENYFKKKSGEEYATHISRYPRDAVGIVRKRIGRLGQDRILRVYAIGGDGIIFDCLNGLMGAPNVELALMPYGTGSDFVRSFGDEHYKLFRDIELQVTSPVIPTDVIHCGNNCALNFCAVGLEAASVIKTLSLYRRFEKTRARFPVLNSLFYTIGGIETIFNRDILNQRYEIEADGKDLSGEYSLINVANGPCYGSGKSAVTTAVPDDGKLDMMAVRNLSPFKALRLITDYLKGGYYKYPSICFLRRVKKLSIRSKSPLLVNLDGEAFFDSEITIEIIPRAIKIVAVNNLGYQRRTEYHESDQPER